ncbi:Spy/CpxP family protein refolding chaperone [Ancylobacter mangrovi]|uniref:Spy/CpxP family protein refolding chaperone n=1 Tax=Ancylobacter mangrovi TaxID=2972472 RepID=UPI002162E393|nr:Spy/CpxP family protein refolding chaperone [Ancylobacter mangrovi]MCS0505154.1 Spy/CpxP family protein refolding chaperone [Ancylobacter mangrovi]
MNHLTIAIGGAISGCLLLAGAAAHAQNALTAPQHGQVIEIYSDADAKAVLNARLAALKTVLELTPEQEKLWPPMEASIRKVAADSMARGKQRAEAKPPADFLDVLDRIGDAEVTRGQDLRSFVTAARPFVAALTEEQKNRMPAFLGMTVDPQAPLASRSLWLFEEEER